MCLPEKRFGDAAVVREVCVPGGAFPGRPAPPFDIGAACATDGQCQRNTCLTALAGGYCTQKRCDLVGCPSGSSCWQLGTSQVRK